MPKQKPVKPRKKIFRWKPTQISMLAHVSFLAFFLIGPFCMAIPLVIWLIERKRPEPKPLILFHARQAFFYQLAIILLAAVLSGLVALTIDIMIGLLFIPFLILAFLAAIGYAVYGGLKVRNGRRFKYKVITDFIERRL